MKDTHRRPQTWDEDTVQHLLELTLIANGEETNGLKLKRMDADDPTDISARADPDPLLVSGALSRSASSIGDRRVTLDHTYTIRDAGDGDVRVRITEH